MALCAVEAKCITQTIKPDIDINIDTNVFSKLLEESIEKDFMKLMCNKRNM
jgi:hypothetical protein